MQKSKQGPNSLPSPGQHLPQGDTAPHTKLLQDEDGRADHQQEPE